MAFRPRLWGVALLASGLINFEASAETLRWVRSGDSLTLDPHSQNEGPTHTLAHQIYEPLVIPDMAAEIVPGLATEWGVTDDPNVWFFKLREGVTFHNGADFTASDVIFSIKRAQQESSDMKELVASIVQVEAVDDHLVHITTDGPNPILPNNLTNMFMMDEDWAKEHDVEVPQEFAAGEDNYAVRNTNGTGPYQLVSREEGTKTVLRAFEDYWGKDEFPLDVTEIIYTPIQNAATRVAALLSGEVDFMQDVPVQDLERLATAGNIRVNNAPQNRTIFFGLNAGDDDLEWDDVEGANPLSDIRVRQAMNMAINRDAIKQVVMRGQSAPTGVIIPPFVNGWTEELDTPPAFDVEGAKGLMGEAGYGDGFGITLHCPNDRYINDEAICQAATAMLGQIGIDVTLDARTKSIHFAEIQNREIDFYLLGWGVPTFDSEYVFNFLYHSTEGDFGTWNATRWGDPELDDMIRSLSSEIDLGKRNQTIADIWSRVQEETVYVPVHNQILNWAMIDRLDVPVQPEDQPKVKYFALAE